MNHPYTTWQQAMDDTLTQRDQAEAWADRLARAIGIHFDVDVGEHSNTNNPWAEALDVIESADPPAVKDHLTTAARPEPCHTPHRCDALGCQQTCAAHFVGVNKMGPPTRQRVYLSGPMTGLPAFNFPAFRAAAARLRAAGYDAVNPAEINTNPAADWHQCLRKDMAALATCDTLALLPGWQDSDGAHLELHVAHRLGLRIVMLEELLA